MGELDPPGTFRERGDWEGGRKLFPRTLSELCSGSSEGTEGFLAPLPVFLSAVALSFPKKKGRQKTRSGELTVM